MISEFKHFSIKKSIFYTVIIFGLFFLAVEALQRIRYCLRFKSAYWLAYGFVRQPDNYSEVLANFFESTGQFKSLKVSSLKEYYDGKETYKKFNPEVKNSEYSINSYGFRGKEFALKKANGTYRIAVIGGSTTFGSANQDGFTYPEYLEKTLNSKGHGNFEVINAGIPSATIHQIELLFKKEIVPLKPDLAIINSIVNNLLYSDIVKDTKWDLIQKINAFFVEKSIFYMTLREKLSVMLNKNIEDLYRANSTRIADNFMNTRSFWAELESNFKDIIQIARSNAIKVVIVEEAVMLGFDDANPKFAILLDKKFEPVYKKAFSLLDKIERDELASVVKTFDYFNQQREKKFFTDGVHLTNDGNECLAVLTANKVIELLGQKSNLARN